MLACRARRGVVRPPAARTAAAGAGAVAQNGAGVESRGAWSAGNRNRRPPSAPRPCARSGEPCAGLRVRARPVEAGAASGGRRFRLTRRGGAAQSRLRLHNRGCGCTIAPASNLAAAASAAAARKRTANVVTARSERAVWLGGADVLADSDEHAFVQAVVDRESHGHVAVDCSGRGRLCSEQEAGTVCEGPREWGAAVPSGPHR
jgi:hypothetical protein